MIHSPRLLLAFPVADRQTGLFIWRAFEQLGWEVTIVDAKERPEKTAAVFYAGDFDLVFCSRTPALLPEIRKIKAGSLCPVVVWNVDKRIDVRDFGPKLLELFNLADLFCTAAAGNVEQYRELCPDARVRFLPQGCDPEFHRIVEPSPAERKRYGCDVMFAGSISPVHRGRRELLDFLKESGIDLKLYGPCAGKPKLLGDDLIKAYRSSKIVLGHNSGMQDIALNSSVRDYLVMASGGFLLTEGYLGIEEYFPGMCGVYRSQEECLEKIDYYLARPGEREEMSKKAYRVVRSGHRYLDRIREVIRDLGS